MIPIGRLLTQWRQPFSPTLLAEIATTCRQVSGMLDKHEQISGECTTLTLLPSGLAVPDSGFFASLLSWLHSLAQIHVGRPMTITVPLQKARLRIGHRLRVGNSHQHYRKENIVVTFEHAGERLALKMAARSSNLARDIRMHRLLAEATGCTPRLVARDTRLRWMVTQYLPHKRGVTRTQAAGHFLTEIAPVFYAYWKPRSRPLSLYLRRRRLTFPQLAGYLSNFGLRISNDMRGACLPYCIIYPGNVGKECFVDLQGRPMIVDWEDVRTGALAEGMLRLYTKHEGDVVSFIQRHSTTGDLDPETQIAIAAGVTVLRNPRARRRMEPVIRRVARRLNRR